MAVVPAGWRKGRAVIFLSAKAKRLLEAFAAAPGPIGMLEAADAVLAAGIDGWAFPEEEVDEFDLLHSGIDLYRQGCVAQVDAPGSHGDLYEPTAVGRRIVEYRADKAAAASASPSRQLAWRSE